MEKATVNLVRRDLAGLITGRMLELGDDGYANSLSIDNGRVTRRPFLVVLPSNTEDVAVTVKYCHERGIRLTTKAGGHSAAGYCLNSEGVVMDLADMNGIAFAPANKQQLNVGAGTRWIQAYDYLRDQQSPYTPIGGGCSGVGVAGFTLGGGYSFISRSYGLGCDNVNGLEFVSTVGNVYELKNDIFTADSNERDHDKFELYRALRGAGGGNFGVVTRIDLQLQETNVRRLTTGQVTFPFYRVNEVLEFYNGWVLKLPDEMAVYGMMRNFPSQRFGGKPTLALRFTPVFNGRFADAIALLEPLLDLDPDEVEFYSLTLPEWEDFAGAGTQVQGHSAYIRSLVLGGGSLTDDVANICKFHLGRAPSPDSYIVWTHTGGAIAKHGDEKSCFAHRDGMFTFELKTEWDSSQPLQARPNIEWAVDFFDELDPYAQGAYLNYIDPLLLEWQTKYYRNEYSRLLKVQQRWNQDGWLSFQQCIGSNYETTPPPKPTLPRTKPLDLSPLSRTTYHVKKD